MICIHFHHYITYQDNSVSVQSIFLISYIEIFIPIIAKSEEYGFYEHYLVLDITQHNEYILKPVLDPLHGMVLI
jgi:hypothetical protein